MQTRPDQSAHETPAGQDGDTPVAASAILEVRIAAAGDRLLESFGRLIDAADGSQAGPQHLATRLGVDKVLTSRLLKAVRASDPISVVHRMPGPEPLRRLLKASGKAGVDAAVLADAAGAVDAFEELIRQHAGDRGSLDAIISAWVPEARREFELRRKQAAFRAMSHLKGAEVDVYAETVFLWPNPDGETIDVVWLKALIGLRRLRPGAAIKFTSRRQIEPGPAERRTTTLDGVPIDAGDPTYIERFCSDPLPRLEVVRAGECVHTMLADHGYGAESAVDLVTCEVNRGELPRWVPAERRRVAWVSSDVTTPAKRQHFDAFVHRDLYNASGPELRVYDTAINGLADLNDPTRDVDRLDLLESVETLGPGISRCRAPSIPRYAEMLKLICATMGWDGNELRCHRVEVEYPVYGMQTALALPTQGRPAR